MEAGTLARSLVLFLYDARHATVLSTLKELALIRNLRADTGPVNLAATAKAYGISRTTLLRYIAQEPGLQKRFTVGRVRGHRRGSSSGGYAALRCLTQR